MRATCELSVLWRIVWNGRVSARQTTNVRVSPYDWRGYMSVCVYVCGFRSIVWCSVLWCLLFRVFVVLLF